MTFIQTKGPKIGRCNICMAYGLLSEDHVPPKGVLRFPRVRLYQLLDALSLGSESKGGRNFQHGAKFRTLCRDCNSVLLGAKYDPELINLSNSVSRYLTSSVQRPSVQRFDTNPGFVARAILGHILALGIGRPPEGAMASLAASLVKNQDLSFPSNLKIYYWLYPYWDQVSIRGFGLVVEWGAPQLVASLIKFMPLAFLVALDADPKLHVPHYCLNDFMIGSGNHTASIPLSLIKIPPHRYPEAPGENGIILHGADSFLASRIR